MAKIISISFTLFGILLSSCTVKGTQQQVLLVPTIQTFVVDLPLPTSSIFTQIPESLDTPYIPNEPPKTAPTEAPTETSTNLPPSPMLPIDSYPPEIHGTLPSGLTIDEYALVSAPSTEPLTYTAIRWTAGEMHIKHNPYRWDTFQDISYYDDWHLSMATTFQGQKLVATEYYTATATYDAFGAVHIYKNDELIDKIPIGNGSPVQGLRGLWTYDQNWVVETAYVISIDHPKSNAESTTVTGQIVKNGVLLNEQYQLDEMFGFQTMHGRPFYFYKQDGEINISYDEQEVILGYDAIPHYGCCSAGILDPHPAKNMVSFFAHKNGTWYYVEVGVFDQ